MANSVDPDQTAPEGAVWSGFAHFAYAILSDTSVYDILGHLPLYIISESRMGAILMGQDIIISITVHALLKSETILYCYI